MTVSMKDIAIAAGVALSTVSRALADSPRIRLETRHRIQRLAEEMGYEPSAIARGLATKRTYCLGVVVMDITDAFIAELVRAIDSAALVQGYRLVLSHCCGDPARELAAIKLLRQQRVDAIIVPDPRVADSSLPALQEGGAPLVLINRRAYPYSVSTDHVQGAREAMEHLLGLGHRRIAYIGEAKHENEERERRAGYEQALVTHGIALDRTLVVDGNSHPAGGRQATDQLLDLPQPPSAVFCFDDLTAVGAVQAAQSRGIQVPHDLSIVGFDDLQIASYLYPPLTTVAQQTDRMGQIAVEMALILAEGGQPPGQRLVPGILVARGSTAPLGGRSGD